METINMREEAKLNEQLVQTPETISQDYETYLAGQRLICRSRLLPKNMQNSREIYEELGFRLYDYIPDNSMYSAVLPEGWDFKPTSNVLWTEIVDDNKLVRGAIYYNAVKGTSSVALRHRYGIFTETTETETPNGLVVEKRVYFGEKDNMLHICGYVGANMNEENAKEILEQVSLFEKVAEDYANKHYPNYEDVRLYWGNQKSKQYTR